MKNSYPLVLHIFRRDLRLEDNTALIAALIAAQRVLPCFIFDPRQIEKNDYKSDHCIQFMVESLIALDNCLKQRAAKLYYFYGIAEEIVAQLINSLPIAAVYINRDYTPYSRARDEKIRLVCAKQKVDFHCFADALLHEPEQILKRDQTPYTIFTHFYRYAMTHVITPIQKNRYQNFYTQPIKLSNHDLIKKIPARKSNHLATQGGRHAALKLLAKVGDFKNYQTIRNFPYKNGTTKLSAHNKFGTISIREFYFKVVQEFNTSHPLIQALHWRDFFTHIAYHFPRVFGDAFQTRFELVRWQKNEKKFQSWCTGQTGFPIVDAGMRELNATGFMHNRVRMITASFLTKDLHIDWRWGEKYFAQHLIDYDPAVNNGNWQWAASTGCDAQPYFRIFNPWLQQVKFDQACLYIKHWIPELARVPSTVIHKLYMMQPSTLTNYPKPIVDHSIESKKTKLFYKETEN